MPTRGAPAGRGPSRSGAPAGSPRGAGRLRGPAPGATPPRRQRTARSWSSSEEDGHEGVVVAGPVGAERRAGDEAGPAVEGPGGGELLGGPRLEAHPSVPLPAG